MTIKDVAKCKRCGSSDTVAEMVVPSRRPGELRGRNEDQTIEIRCRDCGKINRREARVEIE